MTMISATASRSNRVLALCQDATLLAFSFDGGTTLEQLAERLGTLAVPHGGLSLPVQVRLAAGRTEPKGAWMKISRMAETSGGRAIIPRRD